MPSSSESRRLTRSDFELSDAESRLIQEIILDYCGFSFGSDASFFLSRRLAPRVKALGFTSFQEYYRFLQYDPNRDAELQELVERITTHETYFFRESYQLEAFREEVLSEIHRQNQHLRLLTIWSAACSTGEEVYSLAMLVRDDPRFEGWRVRVFGSDISKQVLSSARRACYGENSFRGGYETFVEKYFCDVDGKREVVPEIRKMCSFGQINLLDVEKYRAISPCDIIFCRNVLMYLDQEARRQIVENFYDALAPGGFLLLGHSESLLNLSTRFELAQLERDLVYRRPLDSLKKENSSL